MFGLDVIAKIGTNPIISEKISRLSDLPEEKLGVLVDLLMSVPSKDSSSALTSGFIKNIADNPNTFEWLILLLERLSPQSITKFFNNILINEMIEGQKVRRAHFAQEGFEPPVTIVLNPTMACNLKCEGCYSFRMPKAGMNYSLVKKILTECREIGTRFITVSGGEPFIYSHFFEMVEEFPDLMFLTYTNATLVDEELADRIAQAGNIMPAISVEGFEAETDNRRGKGVFQKVLNAMELFRSKGIFYGFSATPTRQNSDLIASDKFIDFYIEQGALFGWMFQYLPVGKDPDLSLMSTPEQRDKLRIKTKEWQIKKPIFIGDFWNDGPCVGGCLSATRYCYVTPEGKVQPCTFVHFYTHDLNHCSLMDVFRSDFFRSIRGHQPYNKNLLRPCKIIDNPQVLQEIIKSNNARPSYPGAETIIEDESVRRHLENYAKEWGNLADEAWEGNLYQNGESVLTPFLGRINIFERFYSVRVGKEERIANEKRLARRERQGTPASKPSPTNNTPSGSNDRTS